MTKRPVQTQASSASFGRKAAKTLRSALLVLLSLMLVFSCFGCRKSTVLTELVVDQENGKVDEDAEPLYKETLDGPEDSTRISRLKTENDNINDQDQVKATFSRTPNSDEKTKKREQEEDTNKDQEATEGKNEGTGTGSTGGDAVGEVGPVIPEGTTEEPEVQPEGTGEDTEEDPQPTPAGAGGTGQASGGEQNEALVENVTTVAASGQLALIVQMLCNKGALVGADESWLGQVRASGAFEGEGLENVVSCWSGDGSAVGSMNLQAVLDLKPSCVILSSTQYAATSQDDISTIMNNGISVQVIPFSLGTTDTSDDDILRAVEMLGELLHSSYTSGTCPQDPSTWAQSYVDYHNRVIDAYIGANGGYSYLVSGGASHGFIYQGESERGTDTTNLSGASITTAFIDSWLTLSVSEVSSGRSYNEAKMSYLSSRDDMLDCSDGLGLSASSATGKFSLIDYYLQCSGVVDNAYQGAKPTTLPYTVLAGSFPDLGTSTITQRNRPSALWYSKTGEASSSISWMTVGDAGFPGVIVRSEEIAGHVVSSSLKANGLYNVGQSYRVCIAPEGLAGSWADGTIESFLMVTWASSTLLGSDNSINEETATSFYQSFYRCPDPTAALKYYYGDSGVRIAGADTPDPEGE